MFLAVLAARSASASPVRPIDIQRAGRGLSTRGYLAAGQPVAGDPYLPQSWHLQASRVFDAWNVTRGDRRVVLAFVDSGIDYHNPDIAPNLWRNFREIPGDHVDNDRNGFIDDIIGWNFVNGKWGVGVPDPLDRAGHGTFISGIAAAAEGNGIGGAGVCPNCSIMTLRFLNHDGLGDTEDAILGIRYAVHNGASVLNLSFAGEGYDKDLHDALVEASARDIVVVAAAGNDGINNDKDEIYPANYIFPNMLTVAATDPRGRLWENSNWGLRHVQIAAPGTDIIGPWFKAWDTGSGTSLAAPIVAAAAGLIRSANPRLNAPQVVAILMSTVRHSIALEGKIRSAGVLDVGAAMRCAVTQGLPCIRRQF
ncbi:MAG: S8 family serine peptidase [Deltaproteobacteria bacterium]|nr:S8 family serine peptidase [Deltaproteobacteria bacterium]